MPIGKYNWDVKTYRKLFANSRDHTASIDRKMSAVVEMTQFGKPTVGVFLCDFKFRLRVSSTL
jgi:hypothetical protein